MVYLKNSNNTAITLVCQTLVILLCLVAYQHSLNGDFVFDDSVAIVKNPNVYKSPTNFTGLFLDDFWGGALNSNESHKSYRPLTTLMFHFEHVYLNFSSKGMKAINLALHCINSLLVYHFVKRVTECQETAIIASAIFALHPIHVEAVSGIVGRAELMFCLFYLLALLLTQCQNGEIGYWKTFLLFMLTSIALLFKETAVTCILACIFVSYIHQKTYLLPWKQQMKKLLIGPHITLVLMTVCLVIFRLWIQDFATPKFRVMDNPIAHNPNTTTRMLSQMYLYALNIWLLLCPNWLCFDWALGCVRLVTSMSDLRLQSVVTLFSFITMIILNRKYNPTAFLALGLLIIPFLPASGIINVGFVIAERVLYVPSIGFSVLVAHSFIYLVKETNSKLLSQFLKIMLMFVFLCLLLKTRQRATEWQTEEKLFESALKVCPNNAKVHYNIARLASDKSDNPKAIYFYHKAIELYPEYEAALMNLGNLYRETKDFAKAEKYLRAAIQVYPGFAAAWMNLGIVQAAQKQYTQAVESYRNALKYRSNYAVCYYNLGNLYLDQKQYTEAMKNWQKSVALKPKQPKAWSNILQVLDNRGLFEDGLRLSEEALKHLPNETNILFIRANLLGKLKRNIEAESIYNHIVKTEPNNLLFNTNFAILYHRWGKFDKAIEYYRRAVSIDPTKAQTATENLGTLLKHLQREENGYNGTKK